MDAWQGPVTGWQALVGPWVSLMAFAVLLLAVVTMNALADMHPTLGRWRDAAARTVDRVAGRMWAFALPRAEAALRWSAETTDRSLVAIRRVIDEQRSARRHSAGADAPADLTAPTAAAS